MIAELLSHLRRNLALVHVQALPYTAELYESATSRKLPPKWFGRPHKLHNVYIYSFRRSAELHTLPGGDSHISLV